MKQLVQLMVLTKNFYNNHSDKLYGFITTITIAHKMSTIEKCDHIILLDNGEIVSEGSFKFKEKKFFVS